MVVGALSRRYSLLSILNVRILDFQLMKEHYVDDNNMIKIIK